MVPTPSRGIALYNYRADSFYIISAANNDPQGLYLEVNSFSGFLIEEDKEKKSG